MNVYLNLISTFETGSAHTHQLHKHQRRRRRHRRRRQRRRRRRGRRRRHHHHRKNTANVMKLEIGNHLQVITVQKANLIFSRISLEFTLTFIILRIAKFLYIHVYTFQITSSRKE